MKTFLAAAAALLLFAAQAPAQCVGGRCAAPPVLPFAATPVAQRLAFAHQATAAYQPVGRTVGRRAFAARVGRCDGGACRPAFRLFGRRR